MAMLSKEFRLRMRGWRSLLIITLYLGLLGAIGLGTIRTIRDNGGNSGLNAAAIGPQIFGALAEIQLIMLAFITPALTAGAIAGEKERQTYDLLLTTRLSSVSIVLGKLVTSLAYLFLLLLLSLPLFAMAFLFGGTNLNQLGLTFLILLVAALAMGSLSLLVSTLIRRVQLATMVSYVLVFSLILGSGIFANLIFSPPSSSVTLSPFEAPPAPPTLTYLSPLAALSTVVTTPFGAAVSIPFLPLPTGLPDYYFSYSNYNTASNYKVIYGASGSVSYLPNFYSLPLIWPSYLAIYALIIVGSFSLSVLLVRPRRWWRSVKRNK
ncbi:MAG: ABC transporter permease subunit [Chloroflexi bacterium]|nr:ABC transporter permease subunit [Chloroflexota bacterium]